MKLGLGTVQFGLDYGISNTEGKSPIEEVSRIIQAAARMGISFIDTAAMYGDSELILGRILPSGHKFKIVTKTPRFVEKHITGADGNILEQSFIASLDKLNVFSVYGLLIHHADDLLKKDSEILIDRMKELKHRGLVYKIGLSIYNAQQIDRVLEKYSVDLIQLPVNVLDQRLIKSGHLDRLKKNGIEVHVRSAFLQGLLLMDPSTLPEYFKSARNHLERYHETLHSYGITSIQAALGFIAQLDSVDLVICGVNNHKQLIELCSAMQPVHSIDFSQFAIEDERIVNPSLWKV